MIARKSTLIFSFNLFSALLGYVGLFFVVRYMGATPLGIVGFGIAYVTMFSFIADLGFGGAHIKRVSEGKDLGICIATYARIKILLTVIMACVIIGSIIFWKYVLGRGFESTLHECVLYIALFYIIFYTFSSFFLYTFSARQETAKFQIPYFAEALSKVTVTIVIAVFAFGVLALAFSYVLGSL
ncbi:MAG: oligosaccharide flippase family protein, partial [Candidatus Thermoplasmatota archaeon]